MKDEDNKRGAGKEEKATCGAGDQSRPLENNQEMSLEKGTRISPQGLEVGRLWGRKRARESTEWSTPSADQRIYALSLSAKAHPTTPPSSPYLKWGPASVHLSDWPQVCILSKIGLHYISRWKNSGQSSPTCIKPTQNTGTE